jgi:MFS family permease
MTLRYDLSTVGVWLFTIGISQILLEVPTGYIADKFGYKASIALGGISNFSGMILLALTTANFIPIMSGVVLGLGSALMSGATDALAYESMGNIEYEDTLVLSAPTYQFGLIGSVAIGGFLYTIRPELPFIAQGISMLLNPIPYCFMQIKEKVIKKTEKLTSVLSAIKHILKNKRLRSLLIVTSVYFAVIDSWLEVLTESKLIDIGLSPDARGLFISGIKVINLLFFTYVLLRLTKTNISRLRLAMFSIIFFWPLAAMINSFPLFTFVYIGLNIAPFTRDIITAPLIQASITGKLRATELSIFSLSAVLISSVFFLIIGFVVQEYGTSWVFIALATLTAVYVYPTLARHMRNDANL